MGCLGLQRRWPGSSLWFSRTQLLKQLAGELPGPPHVPLGPSGLCDLPSRPPGAVHRGPPFVVGHMPFVSGMG